MDTIALIATVIIGIGGAAYLIVAAVSAFNDEFNKHGSWRRRYRRRR